MLRPIATAEHAFRRIIVFHARFMSDLIQLFYVSRSTAEPRQVEEILAASRAANTRSGLTGALLFTGGHFAQLLEGDSVAVDATMERIVQDPRHADIRSLLRNCITGRRFADWSMACAEVPGADDLVAHLARAPAGEVERVDRLVKLMFANAR